jgi:hypothetical protein
MTSIDPSSPGPCLATTAQDLPCQARPLKGGDDCAAHTSHAGAPPGDRNMDPPHRKFETIDDLIDDMLHKLSILSAMIDQAEDRDCFLKTFNVYGRCVMHFANLLRIKHSIEPPANDFMDILGQAIDELAEEQGWDSLVPGKLFPGKK